MNLTNALYTLTPLHTETLLHVSALNGPSSGSTDTFNKTRDQMQVADHTAACCTLRGSCKAAFYINTRSVPHRGQSVITHVTSQLTLQGQIIAVLFCENRFKHTKTRTLCGNTQTVAVSALPTRSQCVSPMELTFSHSINKAASATEHNNALKNTSSMPPPPPQSPNSIYVQLKYNQSCQHYGGYRVFHGDKATGAWR